VFETYAGRLGAQGAISLFAANINSPTARANNIPVPYAGYNGPVGQALRAYPQYRTVFTSQDGGDRSGNSTYHALVLKVEKRYSSGLALLGSYVFSKFLTDADAAAAASAGVAGSMDQYNRRLEKGLSRRDQTHLFKVNFTYELPFGKGRRLLTSGLGSYLLGGWRIAAIQNYFSGLPLTILPGYQLPLFSTGSNRMQVIDYNGWRAPTKGDAFDPFIDSWWASGAFGRAPADTAPSGAKGWIPRDRFGSATVFNPKTRGPWMLDEAVSIARTFRFTENSAMDFRWEMFNVLNRVVWGGADSTLTSQTFGLIRSQANSPRQMQFGLKFRF
jgi:hypothetical protein